MSKRIDFEMEFSFSVPSKVILFGEHAVVYGFPAVASAVDLRMFLRCRLKKSNFSQIRITFNEDKFIFDPLAEINKDENSTCQMYRTAFYDQFPKNHILNMDFTYNAPSESGLGSSAALCTLVAAAVQKINNLDLNFDKLYEKAKILEGFYHSKSSGIDIATVLYGSSVKISDGKLERFCIPQIPILIVNSGKTRETKTAVEHVSKLMHDENKIFKPILESLGAISHGFFLEQTSEYIKRYFPIAQNLLKSLDLSCIQIDEIVNIAVNNNLSAKLSGAGMGGVVLVSGDQLEQKVSLFNPYETYLTTLGAEGFRIES
ncbi:mevalonate kinase family protein [Tritrichomonas foetus]|uniref:Mevalonate kinase n=1 Tax=Tritrichomonas foetus TaxID=1144522 RepID=A0A1J4K119_9EUKA|nr:mevalonate kinase family protein [Tritrichomonas foetus]|eukprot:OHT05121.1 mevalonate kinase family protein [Tritrichomonas foetus]